MGLPGVKVGPLDPDSSAEFGQVSGNVSARSLIRLHTQAHPKELMEALIRKLDAERTKALDLDEVRSYLAGEKLENGDPVVPDKARIVGAAVRGERDQKQVLTFVYVLPSGRTGKWHAEYNSDVLPNSYEDGTENVRLAELKEKGLVATETGSERAQRDPETERLCRENRELQERLEALQADKAPGGGDDGADGGGDGNQEPAAAENEPIEGFDELKAPDVIALLKAEDTPDQTRQAILDYEKTHANRRGVVGAAEQSLGARGNTD